MVREVIDAPGGTGQGPGMVPGIKAGGFIFLSAIRGSRRGERGYSEDTKEQVRAAFDNIKTNLAGAGATLDNVVKVTVYFHDLKYRALFNEVWNEVFPTTPPARIAMQVADANSSPGQGAHFVLDVVAYAP